MRKASVLPVVFKFNSCLTSYLWNFKAYPIVIELAGEHCSLPYHRFVDAS